MTDLHVVEVEIVKEIPMKNIMFSMIENHSRYKKYRNYDNLLNTEME